MKKENQTVKIIPLGGMEQIGMNITAIEYEDSIIVIDCGLSFPSDDMLGIDLVIPDKVKDPELIKNQVIEVLKTKDPRYHCIITVDTDFISY